jgi:hypothetical protein
LCCQWAAHVQRLIQKRIAVVTTIARSSAGEYLTPETQNDPPHRHWPKSLGEDAYIGVAGDFVGAVGVAFLNLGGDGAAASRTV